MLARFLSQLNPFNLLGVEVRVEDLIRNPLRSDETLVQDGHGRCRRLKAPGAHSPLWHYCFFWIQTHLNQRGHLDAIESLMNLFQEMLFKNPPHEIGILEEFNYQAEQLSSLKNDYGYVHMQKGDSAYVDQRLNSIKKQAYLIFEHFQQQRAIKREAIRKQGFLLFRYWIEENLALLSREYLKGLKIIHFLMVAAPEQIEAILPERIQSLSTRVELIQDMKNKIDEIEKLHRGKFTIPFLKDYIKIVRWKLRCELQKVGIEVEIMIENLVINYRITPYKEKVATVLHILHIDPKQKISKVEDVISPALEIDEEIEQIKDKLSTHL